MKIIFTNHALQRLSLHRSRKFKITKPKIKNTILNPDHIDADSDFPQILASKDLDLEHTLRVVYQIEGDIIVVITLYPAKKGRYY